MLRTNNDIIDNRSVYFTNELTKYLKHGNTAKFATGYFYLNGFNLMKNDLEDFEKIKILMGPETNRQTFDELKNGYQNIHHEPEEKSQEFENLLTLRDFIKFGKVDVKICIPEDESRFHSKLYVVHRNENAETRDVAIIGSSNMTKPGIMGNTELNYVIKQSDIVRGFEEWFDELYQSSDDFNEELISIINNTNTYKNYKAKQELYDQNYVQPFELYKYILLNMLDGDVSFYESPLAEFQKIGVENTKDKIRKFNGAIISDSVGLGKSFIAGEVMRDFYNSDYNILLIVPASIKNQWKQFLQYDGFHDNKPFFGLPVDDNRIKVISDSEFSNMYSYDVYEKFGYFDMVVIDEAHRFRNSEPRKYENIKQLKGRTFLLLSATPLNNSVRDLKNLIDIFTNQIELQNQHLDYNALDKYQSLSKKLKNKDTITDDEEKNRNEYITKINNILEEVMILRTRKDIKERYPSLKINGKPITFPEPKIHEIDYSLSDSYSAIYNNLDDFVENLELPHIYLINETSGQSMEGLYKILLLKRLESSVFSFIETINNLEKTESELKDEINRFGFEKTVAARKKNVTKTLSQISSDPDLKQYIDEQSKKIQSQINLSKDETIDCINRDLETIDSFRSKFIREIRKTDDKYDLDDPKLDKLKTIITDNMSNNQNKILIFTQYKTTAYYLHHHIKGFMGYNIDIVTGDDNKKSNRKVEYIEDGITKQRALTYKDWKVKLFSPNSYNFKLNNDETETDILIATDALSEGVNLQDCNIIVNYDLPWNPTRIIQRVGRVDRIGNDNSIDVFNVKPSDEIDKLLELIDKLETKINDIASIIGKEKGILRDDEDNESWVIGEKINKLRDASSITEIEEQSKNPIFDIIGEDEQSEQKLRLKKKINELNLSKHDFKKYEKIPYTIIETNKVLNGGDNGVFKLYEIYEKKNEFKLRNILLHYNLTTGEITQQNPDDIIDIKPATSGSPKAALTDNYSIDEISSKLDDYFYNEIFIPLRNQYSDSNMRPNIRTPIIQNKVIKRLEDSSLLGNTSYKKKQFDYMRKLFKNIYLTQKDGTTLKNYITENVRQLQTDDFMDKLYQFEKEVIEPNPDYHKRLLYKRNIDYKTICWGAVI